MEKREAIGRYKIVSELGKGSMGLVYKAYDEAIDRLVAVKTLSAKFIKGQDKEATLRMFKREAQAAGRLNHPSIVSIYEYGEEDDLAYIAMEFVDGNSLKAICDQRKRQPIEKILNIINPLLEALAYSHKMGVIHRDIKPANILISSFGGIKIADFGIAAIDKFADTQGGAIMGTPSYMSPEQFTGKKVDNRCDLFSTGAIFYELLTGRKAFEGETAIKAIHSVLQDTPQAPSEINPQVGRACDELVRRALAKHPDQRFASAEEFLDAIREAFGLGRKHASPGISAEGQTETPGEDDSIKVEPVSFSKGHMIFKEGDIGQEAYFILEGQVDIIKNVGGQTIVLATLGENDIFGEMALIDNAPRMASVVVKENVTLMAIKDREFTKHIENANPIVRGLMKRFVANLRNITNRMVLAERKLKTGGH